MATFNFSITPSLQEDFYIKYSKLKDYPTKGMLYANYSFLFIFVVLFITTSITFDYLEYKKTKKVSLIEMIFQSIFSNLIMLGIAISVFYVVGAGFSLGF